jgi:lipopolysaccharide/colanic/teichoic acid biosynthesis glycosyltransferase
MFRRFGPNYMAVLYLLDLGCAVLALGVAQRLRVLPIGTPIAPEKAEVPLFVYGLTVLICGIIFPMVHLYEARRIFRAIDEAEQVVLGAMTSSAALAGMLFLTYRLVSRIVFLYFVVVAVLLLLGYRAGLRVLYRKVRWGTQAPVVLIVGAGPLGRQTAEVLSAAGVRVAGFVDDPTVRPRAPGNGHAALPGNAPGNGQAAHRHRPRNGRGAKRGHGQGNGQAVLAGIDEVLAVVERYRVTDIVIALPRHAQEGLARLLVSLWKLPLRVFTIPDLFDLGVARLQMDHLGGLTLIGLREPLIDGFQRVAKRLVDLVLGGVLLLGALPVMGVIALVIRRSSPGPIIFRQQRVGENGRLFTMYKFRTMVADAEQKQEMAPAHTLEGKVVHKRLDDPRVTRVGRLLRRLSLDELPQLVNVLRGEMSLVGPRPEMPWVVAGYDPWQYQRLAVPQGMTSWYVVNGRSEVPMHLNTQEDLRYIQDYSLFQDLKILWMSVGAVLKGRGAF